MSGFFDFLKSLPPYDDNATTVHRLDQRHRLIIDPFQPQIAGARVLDLAAHDGRWSYALAHAGALERFTYVSTAGGAFLEWLEGKTLPGVAALETAAR